MAPPAGGEGGTCKAGLSAGRTGEVETNLKGEVVRFPTKGSMATAEDSTKGSSCLEARTRHKSMVKAAGVGASTGFKCGGGLEIAGDATSKQECIIGRAEDSRRQSRSYAPYMQLSSKSRSPGTDAHSRDTVHRSLGSSACFAHAFK